MKQDPSTPNTPLIASLAQNANLLHPGLSINCAIFGFHDGNLKILVMQYKGFDEFIALPGSFLFADENVDDAANRILYELTGLKGVFLRQFHVFGDANRKVIDVEKATKALQEEYQLTHSQGAFFFKRYATLGYYALIDYTKVNLTPFSHKDKVMWVDYTADTLNYYDHSHIAHTALETLRTQLRLVPIGKELLPEKFTMTELRMLYESILGRELDRRNFQRKILSQGYIDKLPEHRHGGAHKSPTLYSFNTERYQAMHNGAEWHAYW